jgi:hypothetical protein
MFAPVTQDRVGFVEDDTVEGTERLLRSWLSLTPDARQAMVLRTDACFDKRFSMRSCALALRTIFEEAQAESFGSRKPDSSERLEEPTVISDGQMPGSGKPR